jgi:hypothetical protein
VLAAIRSAGDALGPIGLAKKGPRLSRAEAEPQRPINSSESFADRTADGLGDEPGGGVGSRTRSQGRRRQVDRKR